MSLSWTEKAGYQQTLNLLAKTHGIDIKELKLDGDPGKLTEGMYKAVAEKLGLDASDTLDGQMAQIRELTLTDDFKAQTQNLLSKDRASAQNGQLILAFATQQHVKDDGIVGDKTNAALKIYLGTEPKQTPVQQAKAPDNGLTELKAGHQDASLNTNTNPDTLATANAAGTSFKNLQAAYETALDLSTAFLQNATAAKTPEEDLFAQADQQAAKIAKELAATQAALEELGGTLQESESRLAGMQEKIESELGKSGNEKSPFPQTNNVSLLYNRMSGTPVYQKTDLENSGIVVPAEPKSGIALVTHIEETTPIDWPARDIKIAKDSSLRVREINPDAMADITDAIENGLYATAMHLSMRALYDSPLYANNDALHDAHNAVFDSILLNGKTLEEAADLHGQDGALIYKMETTLGDHGLLNPHNQMTTDPEINKLELSKNFIARHPTPV